MLIIAHRSPTTAEGCAAVLAAGAHVFEVDVRLSGTVPVVSHFLDVPGTGGVVQRDNWRLRAGVRGGRDRPLSEQVSLIPRPARVLLDLKEQSAAARALLVDTLIQQFDRRRFIVSAPWPDDLRTLRDAGWTTWRTVRNRSMLQPVLASATADAAVTVRRTLLTPAVVAHLHQWAPAVMAWTVNTVEEAERLRSAGVDGVTTDSADVMRALA